MKTTLFAMILLTLIACEENETKFTVNPDLSGYVEAFYNDAQANGVTLPRNLIADFGVTQAITFYRVEQSQNVFYYDRVIFDYQKTNGFDDEIEKNVYTTLGRLFMKKNIQWHNREQYLADIFGN